MIEQRDQHSMTRDTDTMTENRRLVERGEGYWCFEKEKPPENSHPPVAMSNSDPPDPEPIETVGVHRPVIVEVDDSGDAYAYYYDTDASVERIAENGGKVFVPMEQVYLEPPDGFETPAYKVGDD